MIDLRSRVLANPDKAAYVMGASGETVTRMDLEERANRCAHLFRNRGLFATRSPRL